jgi:anti-sigma-K factor RskA
MMNTQHIAPEDLALYALQALSPEESAIVTEHLSTCATCQQELAEINGDMALLALSVEQQPLPAGATERFMERVASTAPAAAATVLPFVAKDRTETVSRRSVWPVLVPWAAAAALTAVCISLGIENKNLSDTVNAESSLLTTLSAKAAHAQQLADVLNAPSAQRVTLTLAKHPADPTGHAIYLPDRGALLFEANNLQPLNPGKTYELWVIPANGTAPVPAGVFKPNASGYASVVLPQLPPGIAAKAFGVTIENDPGASTPTMPIVLAGG